MKTGKNGLIKNSSTWYYFLSFIHGIIIRSSYTDWEIGGLNN